jgi:peptidyl-prolyl cis-trans isomerase D
MATKPRTLQSWLAVALMGLLVLVFLLLGVGGGGGRLTDLFANRSDAVIVAGQHVVTSNQFKRIFEQQKQRFDQQAGQPVPLDVIVQNGVDRQMLEQMSEDRAFLEMLRRAGVRPAASIVDAEIKKLPFAFDRVTGKFSAAQFTSYLAQLGMTPRDVETELRDDLASRHFTYAVELGFRAPRSYSALNAVRGLEQRDLSFFVLGRDAVPLPAMPTDAQLTAFIKEHAAQLTIPETRVITLVRFSAKALEPTVAIDPAALQKEFDFKKDSLSTPETRSLVQIPVKSAQQGAEAAARLARGEDPATVAKAYGADPITYADKPRSAIPDRKLAAAVFALAQGESRAIQGDLGLSAVHVLKVTPGVVATLEAVRPQLEAELRRKGAEDRVYDLSQKFDEARQAGDGVAAAAAKAGVPAMSIGQITAQGVQADGQRNPLINEKMLKDAFEQTQGAETDLTDAGPGEYYALKVERVNPPSLPSIDSRRQQLTAFYMQTEFLKALQAKIDGLIARIKNGESIDKVAASAGAQVNHQVGLARITAQQYVQVLGRDFLERTFSAKPTDVFSAPGPNGIFVARLDAVRSGDLPTLARITEGLRPRVSQEYVGELAVTVRQASAKTVKVTTNLDMARRAIGVDPATLPQPASKGGKPAAKPGERAK